MSREKNIIKRIIAILILVTMALSEASFVGAAYDDNRITSNKYLVSEGNGYIARIEPETSIEEFKQYLNIDEHRIHVYTDKTLSKEITEGYIKTGMVLKCEEIEDIYDLVVIGDMNEDGLMNQIDLNILIKHVVGEKDGQLEGLEAVAADILYDRKIDQIDITTLIRYIVYHELNETEIKRPGKPTIEMIKGNEGWNNEEITLKITENEKSEVKIDRTMYQIAGVERKVEGDIKVTEEGEHQVLAYSYSIDGAKSEIESKTVKIDRTAPRANISASNKEGTVQVKVNAVDSLSGIGEYTYYLGETKDGVTTWGKGESSSNSEHSFTKVKQGEYEVKVVVIDKAGNTVEKIASVNVTTIPELVDDKTAEEDKNNGVENPREANVTVERSETDWTNKDVVIKVELKEEVDPEGKYELEYSKDGGETWEPYNPETGIVVEENTDIEVRLTDGEKHGESLTIPVTNIDKESPIVKIETNPDINEITVNVYATDGISGVKEYVYYIGEKKADGSIEWKEGIKSDKSSYTFEELEQDKEYEIKVEVKDKAGNVTEEQTTQRTKKIPELVDDKTAEEDKNNGVENPREANVTVEKSETDWTNKDVIIKIEVEEVVDPEGKYELEYSKDGGETWEPYDPETGIVVEENTEIEVRLTDGKEHGESLVIPVTNIDKKAPTVEIKTEGTKTTIEVQVTASDEDSGIAEYVYYIGELKEDGTVEWKEGISVEEPSYTFEGLEQGKEYKIKVEVKDKAGNSTEKETLQKTTSVPELVDEATAEKDKEDGVENPREANVTVERSETDWTNEDVVIKIKVEEEVDPEGKYELEYSKDGGETWEPYNPETGIIVEENTNIEVRLTDGTEHGESLVIPVTNIDKDLPTASMEVVEKRASIEVAVTAEDIGSGIQEYRYYIGKEDKDGNIKWEDAIIKNEPNHIFNNLKENTEYKIKVEVVDKAGNVAEVSKTATTVDGISTSKYITMTTNTKRWTKNNVIVTITENSTAYEAEYSLDGKTWIVFQDEKQIEMKENGTIYTRIKDENEVGDVISLTVGNIDKEEPEAKITPIEITSRSIKVKLEGADSISGIAQIVWKYKSATQDTYEEEAYRYVPIGNTLTGKAEESKEFTYEDLLSGNYWVCAEITDAAGNVTTTDVEVVDPIEITSGEEGVEFSARTNWINEDVAVNIQSTDSRYTLLTSIDGKNYIPESNYVVEQNSSIYAKLTDGINYGKVVEYKVENIDKKEPTAELSIHEITSKRFQIDLNTKDNLSGIGKVEWYYKNVESENYEKQTIDLVEIQGNTAGNLQEEKQLQVDNLERGMYIIYARVYDVAGNSVDTAEIRLELEEITKGEESLTFTLDNTNWTNGDVEVTVTNTDERYRIQTSNNGVEWNNSDKVTITQNGDAIARLTDGVNFGQTARKEITNIDKSPAVANLQVTETTSKTMTITAMIADNASGLAKIDWYYRLKGTEEYHQDTQEYQTIKGATAGEKNTQKSIKYEELRNGTYEIYAVVTDVAGNETITNTVEATLITIVPGNNGIEITSSNENWTNEDVQMTATSKDERYTVQTSKDGRNYQDTEEVNFEANGTIYARLTDGVNVGLPTSREITNIDKEGANVKVEAAGETSKTFTQVVKVKDNSSGLSKIELYYRKKGETEYRVEERTYQTQKGPIAGDTNTSKSIEVQNLINGTYETYVVVTDVAGNRSSAEDSSKDNPKEVTLEVITAAEDAITITPSNTNWTNDKVVVTVTNTDERYQIQTKPSDEELWQLVSERNVFANATIEARLFDGINGGESSSITITNIDTTKATGNIECTGFTTKEMSLKVTTDDEASGIGQITWYYKKDGESSFRSETESYRTIQGSEAGEKHVEAVKTFGELSYGKYIAYAVITDVAGNTTATSQIEITLEQMPTAVDQITLTPNNTNYTNGNVMVEATTTNTDFVIQTSIDGESWSTETQREITENRTVYGRLYDGVNGGEAATLSINNIDKTGPVTQTITYEPTGTTLDLTLNVTDNHSGIAKVVWYYKDVNVDNYTSFSNTFVEINGNTAGNLSQTLTKQLTGLIAGNSYNIYAEVYDVAGNMTTSEEIEAATNRKPVIQSVNLGAKTTNTLTISARATDEDGNNLAYSLYVSTNANSGYTKNGTASGAAGATVNLQATGLAEYTLYYYYIEVTDQIATVTNTKGSNVRTYCPGNTYSCTGSTDYCSGATSTCSGTGYTCSDGYEYSTTCSSCSGSGSRQCSKCRRTR